jgi:hypothetical protein
MKRFCLFVLLPFLLSTERAIAQEKSADLRDCRGEWRSVESKWRGNEIEAQKLFIERCMRVKGYDLKKSCTLGTNDIMLLDCYLKLDTGSPAMRRLLLEEACLLDDLRAGQKGMDKAEREICIRRARER